MTDEELRKIDIDQLMAEKAVLEVLLQDYMHPQRKYWQEELARIDNTLKGVFLPKSDRTSER